jgi:hypothetical protein
MWEECRGPKQNPNDCIKYESQNTNKVIKDLTEKNRVELPSTMEMAKNFITSATNHIKSGMKNVSEEIIQHRLSICDECEFKVKESNRCGKCGCFLGTKTKWESSHCPIGKW